MPIIDGEKWACQSCIKGHRVSGCTHTDRDLHHINPKGRPVKQCEHCRGARKSKSHHAKCDCGDKKDKHYKDKGDTKGDASGCHCHSTGKCICGLKKDGHGLKLETVKHRLHDARTKPKLPPSTHSESTLTVFANGHHKPCHRNNMSAHNSGLPYKIPRPHTLHGPSAFASYSHENLEKAYGTNADPVQRSMDTLSLSNNDFHLSFGSAPRSMDASLPVTPLTANFETPSFGDPFTQNLGVYNQGAGSPSESQLSDSVPQWPFANSMTSMPQFGAGSLSTSPSQDCLPNLAENDWPIPSAGLNDPLWSAGDLPLIPAKVDGNLVRPISHSGESTRQSAPGLSTSSSAQSEVGETSFFGDLPSGASDTVFWEDSLSYRLGTSEAMRPGPTSVPASSEPIIRDADRGVDKGTLFSEPEMRFDPSTMIFPNTGVDETQAPKESNSDLGPVMMTSMATTATDASSMFSTAGYSEPGTLGLASTVNDFTSANPWLPPLEHSLPLDLSDNTDLGLSNYDPSWYAQ